MPPDPETLRAIARGSGGQAFEADDADQLDHVYSSSARGSARARRKREITAGFAAGGLVLLLGGR